MRLKQNHTSGLFKLKFKHTLVILLAALLMSSVASAVVVEDNVQITNGTNQNAPNWSPDGKKIAYSSDQGIWTMDADGSNQKQLFDSVVWDGEPDFNDDSSKIFFASEYVTPTSPKFISIHVMDSDGSNRVQLTKNADMRSPALSPDGSTVVYISKLSGNYDIWTMSTNGSNRVRLTDESANEWTPTWSFDGKSIVYSSEGNIGTIDREGIRINRLTNDTYYNIDPSFSPDDSKIVFASDRSGNSDLWMMNSNGTGALQLTFDESEQKHPSWAPDGERIVYSSNEDGNYNIWVMSLGNTDQQIEYVPAEELDTQSDSVIEELLKDYSLSVIALVIIVALLLVVFIVRLFIRSL